ncbi:hypothetical protein LUZ62_065485 [Rhynchospora pubera]|uniref:Cytochrome P450 n=1 Tax=Rhynchospora pubera TaxID=906938 RepID=A0AAV8EJ56_9POAL|nr:hypothetical protein LUZ62_065485 [Rhynchospora pubera]
MEALHLIAIFIFSYLLLKLFFLAPKPKHTAKLPPSPPSLPIIGHLHLLKKPLHRSLSLLSEQYGPILYLRLGYRPTLVISSRQLVDECFTTNDVALANRPNFPSVKELTNNYSNLAFSNYGPSWRHLRKTATVQILSNHRLLLSTSSRNDEARYLAHRLFVRSADDKSSFNKSLLQAGTETSSNTIEWAMSLLLNNPHVLAKAQHEIHTVVGRDRLLEESDVPSLPYLRAIINETLRLHPAAPLNLPHESAADSIIGGYKIPKGTTIYINIHAIHQDPSIWKDPTEFKPERFENGKGEGLWLLPFGMGRRKCPGEGLAIKMIALALGTLIQCFEWQRIGSKEVDMTEGSTGFAVPKAVSLDAMYRPWSDMVPLLMGL